MEIFTTVSEMKNQTALWKQSGKSIGLVPTMGYLHAGHASLIEEARRKNDVVVVSIFVNPSQFAPNEDFERYPRDMAADSALCLEQGVDAIFAPSTGEMYPEGYISYVDPVDLSTRLCGKSRPGHFRGVCTVVLKLFNIMQPDRAYFGQKDAQQLIILSRMVEDLNLDLQICPMPIIRESDGLAISSRNVYLSGEERAQAVQLYAATEAARRLYAAGERSVAPIVAAMECELAKAGLARIDYLEIVDLRTLNQVERIEGQCLAAMAVYFGKTRLIDNILLG